MASKTVKYQTDLRSTSLFFNHSIVFAWSQNDGGNIDKEQRPRLPPKPNEAKLNIMGGDLFWILTPNILIQSFTV